MWPLVFAILFLGAYLLYVDVRKPKGFPNGPNWLPILGNYTHFTRKLKKLGYYHLVWKEFADEYGHLIGLRMGKQLVVVVDGLEMIREVLSRDEFMGRPDGFLFTYRTFGKKIGVVFAEGPFWEKQRKFLLQNLRSLGLGRTEMEAIIIEEARELIKHLARKSQNGDAIEMKSPFDVSVINTLWALIAGKRYDLEDERLQLLANLVHEAFSVVEPSGGLLNQMPFLRHVAPDLSGFTTVAYVTKKIVGFLRQTVEEHRESHVRGSPRDLIDMFLEKMADGEDETFTEEQLLSLCIDLFMAGSETTANTLSFFVLYMAEYPEIQRRIQNELFDVLGSRFPTYQDKIRLPFTEATLLEVQRLINVAPIGIPHRTVCDVQINDSIIPEGTIVLTNLYSINMDAALWGDPHSFRPDRFLNEEGRLVVPEKHFMPFGLGKRRCLGESLAKTNYFIFICALLQRFTFGKDPNGGKLDLLGRNGFTLTPESAKLILTSQNQ